MNPPKAYLNWSSGKDSTMALYFIRQNNQFSVDKLLTTVNKKFNRVSMHGLHRNLLEAQAKAIGIPLDILEVSETPTMEAYNELMKTKVEELHAEGYRHTIFGDIFLEDLRKNRENQLAPVGIQASFPLWKKDTRQLLSEFIALGFKAIVVCCQASSFPKSFCGRLIDKQFLRDLPAGIDACGENGEFHTFCFDGPLFSNPVNFTKKGIVYKGYPAPKLQDKNAPKEYGFWYLNIELAN